MLPRFGESTSVGCDHRHEFWIDAPQHTVEDRPRFIFGDGKTRAVDHRPQQLSVELVRPDEIDDDPVNRFGHVWKFISWRHGQRIAAVATLTGSEAARENEPPFFDDDVELRLWPLASDISQGLGGHGHSPRLRDRGLDTRSHR